VGLLDELRSQLFHRDVGEVLKLVLFREWTNHSATVTILEETFEQAADSIFLIDGLTETLLVLKGFLQVVFRCNWLRIGIDELQGEITDDPHQRREVLGVLFGIGVFVAAASFDLNVLGEVDDETEVV